MAMDRRPVFVTAPNAGIKVLNRAFLLLLEFRYSQNPYKDSAWFLINSRALQDETPKLTSPPIEDIARNDFARSSLDDINTFMRSHEAGFEKLGMSTKIWLIIDQKGIDSSTCLIVEQMVAGMDNEDEEIRPTDKFRAVRIPYFEASNIFANLEIGNMDFIDFVDEDAGVQSDGAYKITPDLNPLEDEELKDKQDAALEDLRKQGHVE